MVARKDVAEEKRHPDLCQSGHASAHDSHPPSHHASFKVLSWGAQELAYGLLTKSQDLASSLVVLTMLPLL